MKKMTYQDTISLALCGEAGQGIQTVEYLLARMFKQSGFHIFATKEYMSRIRGGSNATELRISSKPVTAFVDNIDILIPFDKAAYHHVEKRVTANTIILADQHLFTENELKKTNLIDFPLTKTAMDAGGKIYVNTVATGVIAAICTINKTRLINEVNRLFSNKKEEIQNNNRNAAEQGYEIGSQLVQSHGITVLIKKDDMVANEMLLSGSEAVGLGALVGGCNFISSYPMSPSTGILTFLSSNSQNFDVVAEQAEDEISAINMALGASYAGARAMVTTSGGGFALMVEGVSLAGMLELPLVIHLSQRPGPATGLPTRTEQADLLFSLFAGHGEFPRIMFAPRTLEEAFFLSAKAFNLADKYQIPVFILTDQYFVDSYYNTKVFDIGSASLESSVVKTDATYRRYPLTKNGISPRGIPGFGNGLICVDSDEHDEEGHITENLDVRTEMVDKRLRKLEEIKKDIIPPELKGPKDFTQLVVGWGSTYYGICEAVEHIKRNDLAVLHFSQIYPVHPKAKTYLDQAENIILVENNATGQFGQLLKLHTGIDIPTKILQYNGLPFSVETLVKRINHAIQGGK